MRHILAALALAVIAFGSINESAAHMAGCNSKYYLAADPQAEMDALLADFIINREDWKTKSREELVAFIFQLRDAHYAAANAYDNFIFCFERQQ